MSKNYTVRVRCEVVFDNGKCMAPAVAVVSCKATATQLDVCADCYRDRVLHDQTHSLIEAYDLGSLAAIKA